jgi:hypothetical protein
MKESLRDSLARQRSDQADSHPVLDPRTPDEIIGYNEIGVPE